MVPLNSAIPGTRDAYQKHHIQEFPGSPVVGTLSIHHRGPGIQSLLGKLESRKLCGTAKKKKKKKKKKVRKKKEFPWWLSGKESTYQCRRHGFDP